MKRSRTAVGVVVVCLLLSVIGGGDALAACSPAPTAGDDDIECTGAPAAPDQNLGDGNDTLTTIGVTTINNDIFAGNGNDEITINTGGRVIRDIRGQNNIDTINVFGSVGRDVRGDNGNDILFVNGGSVGRNLRGDAGNDVIMIDGVSSTVANVLGDDGDDIISLINGTVNQLNGGNNNDTLNVTGGTVNGTVQGGGGNDTINLTGGTIGNVQGGGGSDIITVDGATINTFLRGNGGNDIIDLVSLAGPVNDVEGGSGNDTIIMRAGVTFADINVEIDGGNGNGDILQFEQTATRTLTDADENKYRRIENIDLFGAGVVALQDTNGSPNSAILNTGTNANTTIDLQEGTLQFVNADASIQTGTFTASANTLITGSGFINARDSNLNGVVQPGGDSAISTLTFDGPGGFGKDVNFGASNVTVIDLQGGVLANDTFIVDGDVTIAAGADLVLNLISGTLAVGDSFDIITSDSITGNFNLIVVPSAVVAGARWETNIIGGVLQALLVTDVPAPPMLIMMLMGLGGLIWLRRQRVEAA